MSQLAKALQDILADPRLTKFVDSLNHADLPTGWQNDNEIVDMAGTLYREMGTDSPFFKAWGGSEQPFYHGTGKQFDSFSNDEIGNNFGYDNRGFFFTSNKNQAQQYANGTDWSKNENPNVIEAFLKTENPLLINSKTLRNNYGLNENGVSNIGSVGYWDDNKKWLLEEVDSMKNDSVMIEDDMFHVQGRPETLGAVFEPTQIKSTSNRGTFDPQDPNIYRALPWLVGGGVGAGALLGGSEEAEAAFIGKQGLSRLLGEIEADNIINEVTSRLGKGEAPETVFRDTGGFIPQDGNFRYEIGDMVDTSKLASLNSSHNPMISNNVNSVIQENSPISSLYDKLQDTTFYLDDGDYRGGGLDSKYNQINIGSRGNIGDKSKTMEHELQHAVQLFEGLPRGGSAREFDNIQTETELSSLLDRKQLLDDEFMSTESLARTDEIIEELAKLKEQYGKTTPEGKYYRLAGEAEARESASRLGMTQEQRRANYPEYAKRDDLIVKYGVPLAVGGGTLAATLSPEDSYAQSLGYKNAQEWANSQGVKEALWSPADLAVAPIGAAGASAKALAMALDLPITYSFDKLLSAIIGD